jgi:Pyruvate/2-oxoacid:ferredoxin oxidoreductase delta subunit
VNRRSFLRGAFLTGGAAPAHEPQTVAAGGDAVSPPAGPAMLDRAACMAWDGVVCMSCRFACDDLAIFMDGQGRPHVEDDRCIGCGSCAGVCPAQAISFA